MGSSVCVCVAVTGLYLGGGVGNFGEMDVLTEYDASVYAKVKRELVKKLTLGIVCVGSSVWVVVCVCVWVVVCG